MLGMPEARVRELARDALHEPGAGQRRGRRRRLARPDRRLPARPAGRARGRGRPAATCAAPRPPAPGPRSRARLARAPLPEGRAADDPVADAAGGPRRGRSPPRPPRAQAVRPAARPPEAAAIVQRRRDRAGVAAGAVALLVVLLIWPVGLAHRRRRRQRRRVVSGPCGDGIAGAAASARSSSSRSSAAASAAASPQVTSTGGQCAGPIVAKLPRTRKGQAYEVWLVQLGRATPRSLGAQVTDKKGNFAGAAPCRRATRATATSTITRETVDRNDANSGNPVLRGPHHGDPQQQTGDRRQRRRPGPGTDHASSRQQLAGVHDPGRVERASFTARSTSMPSVADLGRHPGAVVGPIA